jgi:hypothetical protein
MSRFCGRKTNTWPFQLAGSFTDQFFHFFIIQAIFSVEFQRQNDYQYEAMCHARKKSISVHHPTEKAI